MTKTDLETLKSNLGKVLEIETTDGENLLIRCISLFDEESDPDLFYWDLTSEPEKADSDQTHGYSISLNEIKSVRVAVKH